MATIEHITHSVRGLRPERGSAISPAEEAAIARQVRATNPPLFWSMRVLPASRRKAIYALYAFCRELGDVGDSSASRALKLNLFTDWRGETALLYAGCPRHVVARALHDAVQRLDLHCADFLAIISGVQMDSCFEMRAPSHAQLDLYCEQTAVAIGRIALRILGVPAADGEPVAAAMGRGIQLTRILRDLTQDAAARRLYLPPELLHAHRIFATIPSYVLAQPALPQVCETLAQNAAAHFAEGERAINTHRHWAMLAAKAMLVSYRALLEALLLRGWSRLDEPVGLAPWHRAALRLGDGRNHPPIEAGPASSRRFAAASAINIELRRVGELTWK
jgi:phytoene synthase